MKTPKVAITILMVALALILGLSFPGVSHCQDGPGSTPPVGIWVELTRDFYDALNESGRTRTYTNDLQQEYLRQTSVSSKFVVQTNIEILKRQEKIIHLLESILKELQKKQR